MTPDTLRAIILVTLSPNGVARSRMGYVVIEEGKRPVYLDCRKRALKWPQVGVGMGRDWRKREMIRTKAMINARPVTQKDKWETPGKIYKPLNKEFGFTLDPCCEPHTAKCAKYYTMEDDGLSKDWQGETVFCNPPYSNGNIDLWMEKCYNESLKPNTIVVALVAVSTSANWFHDWVLNKGELRFVERRVRFVGAPYTATFSSVIVVFGRTGIKSFKQCQ